MKKLTIILTVLFVTISMGLTAQNLNSAGKAYNKGIELNKEGNTLEAIGSYQKCADICAKLGEIGEGLKINAETQICKLYMNMGTDIFKAKDYDSAIGCFTQSAKYAELINDASTTAKINNYFAVAYTGKGNTFFKTKKYKDAIENYKQAVEYNPEYTKAYYGLVLSYSKTDDSGMLEESVKKIFELSNDEQLLTKTKTIAAKYYLKMSGNAIRTENYNVASMMATKSIQYNDTETTAFYYLALARNSQENWEMAKKSALKGITFDQEDKSNLYFELGRAYEGLGDTEKACEAYSNVTGGPNKEGALYQRGQVLHCN
ncbi:MAG: tetratricopeptide repeat protein [Bacteroidales bacterium]|nr:tetratricopeptide repeat protein [Bacteroidales bacterium]